MTGEASPEYFTKTGVPQSIYEVVPDVRLIFLFRDPVGRAISDHQMLVNAGVETRTFEERARQTMKWFENPETKELLDVCRDVEHHPARYLARGRYADHIGPWLDRFGRGQMLFLDSEEFFADPGKVVNEVFAFIGLSKFQAEEWTVFKKGRYSEKIDSGLREELAQFFGDANQRLVELTGRSWSWM